MRMSTLSGLLFILLTQSALAQTANQPYVGSWHLNVAKSDIGTAPDVTISVDGAQRFTLTDVFRKSYTFAVDGRAYDDPYGAQVVWSKTGPTTYRATATMSGKQVWVDTIVLDADSNSFSDDNAVVDASGKLLHQKAVYTRQGSGTGLA